MSEYNVTMTTSICSSLKGSMLSSNLRGDWCVTIKTIKNLFKAVTYQLPQMFMLVAFLSLEPGVLFDVLL